jgi:hypothetical protein
MVLGSQLNLASLFPATAPTPPLHCHVSYPSPPAWSSLMSAKQPAPSSSPATSPVPKPSANTNLAQPSDVPLKLGGYINRDVKLLWSLGWHGLAAYCSPLSNFS